MVIADECLQYKHGPNWVLRKITNIFLSFGNFLLYFFMDFHRRVVIISWICIKRTLVYVGFYYLHKSNYMRRKIFNWKLLILAKQWRKMKGINYSWLYIVIIVMTNCNSWAGINIHHIFQFKVIFYNNEAICFYTITNNNKTPIYSYNIIVQEMTE